MRYHERARPLRYFGGKARASKQKWIAGLLPWAKETVYVEPFGGMMSVLLYRAPVTCECYNDLNGDVVNWWRVVRDDPDWLGRALEYTPMARAELDWAMETLAKGDEVDARTRALAFYCSCMMSQVVTSPGGFRLNLEHNHGPSLWNTDRVSVLARRLRRVQLENTDALHLLKRTETRPNCVVYCDPPYAQSVAGGDDYAVGVDYEALALALQAQQGRVAVSGYGDEWDKLGWQRFELETSMPGTSNSREGAYNRTEVLWLNFDASVEGCAYDQSMALSDVNVDRSIERSARGLSEAY